MNIQEASLKSIKNLDLILLAVVIGLVIAVIAPTGISGALFGELMKMIIPSLVSAFAVKRAYEK